MNADDRSVSNLEFNNVTYRYRTRFRALDSLSLTWPPRGVVALLGPNGAGKTTLLSLLVGTLKLQSGSISVPDGALGFVAQDASWPGRFTVRELLEYAAWWQRVPKALRTDRVVTAAGMLGLDDLLDRKLNSLSGGYYRRAMVSQALVHDPSMLILDEPTAGLDPRQRATLRAYVAEMASSRLIVIATHLVDDVAEIARWVTVLDEGTVAFSGAMTEVRTTYGGSATRSLESLYLESTRPS